MPRKYIVRDGDNISIKTAGGDDGAFNQAEAKILGNTDWDAINNPITSFNFVLMVEAVYWLPLKSVRAFTKENEFEYIKEGGVNDYVHMKRKPISKPFTFQIERYIGTERFLDPLALGTELILPLCLLLYRHKARSGLTEGGTAYPARIYVFTGCVVTSKEYGELNAERSGLVTETTTIAYREMMVLNNGFESLGINFMSAEDKEWSPDDNKDSKGGYKTKYAAFSPLDDKSKDTYLYEWSNDSNGMSRMSMKPKAGYKFFKEKWDGKPDSKTWATKAKTDDPQNTYEVKDVDGKPTMVRKDSGDYNRPQYQMSKDMDKEKYATKAYLDKNSGEKIYDKDKDKEGQTHIKRVDHAQINKPAWTGENGAVNQWAKQAGPDKAKSTYNVTTKDGVNTIKRKDSSAFNRPQYELKKDGTKQKYSEVAPIDKNAGQPIYKKNGATVERVDKAEINKKPYELHKDRQKNKYAATSPKDKETPEAREPYSIKDDGAKAKYAKMSPTDSQKPEAKEPYSIKDGATPKHAKPSPVDSQKPEAKDPYQIKDGATAKYAAKSPKDSEKAEAKAPYSIKDGATAKYAAKSPKDSEKAEAKEPYSIKDGATPKHAKPSPVDSQKPVAKEPYKIKDGASPKHATPSPTDSQKAPAKGPYKIKDGSNPKFAAKSPKDSEKAQARDPYKIKDGASPKHAAKSPKDSEKAQVRDPYKIGDGATPKHAAVSPKDGEKAQARNPYNISEGPKAKYAKVSPKDSEKAQAREPYQIKDGAKPKYAIQSPKDNEKPQAVTWPPTRRALTSKDNNNK